MPSDLAGAHPYFLLALFFTTLVLVWRRRTLYRVFAGVMLGVLCLIWWGLFSRLSDLSVAVAMVFEALSALHFVRLAQRPRLTSPAFRAFLTIPAMWFAASTYVALPFAFLHAFGLVSYVFLLAYVVGAFGVWQSLTVNTERVALSLDRDDLGPLKPFAKAHDVERAGRMAEPLEGRPLRVVQITDPHLGPFMSVAQLKTVCERAVAMEPDLVLVTGDLLTMESHGAIEGVAEAFSPLRALEGRCFACHGNHDHEDRKTVREGLERAGVRLLVDEWCTVDTPIGEVELVGADFHFRERPQLLAALFEGRPLTKRPRLLMLHDPGHIRHVPEGCADLTLCGHTHGGHVGLLSLGFAWTFVRGFTSIPDHGLWARGRDRIYVHRGTGHYGFPIRLGVPREESLLEIYFAPRSTRS